MSLVSILAVLDGAALVTRSLRVSSGWPPCACARGSLVRRRTTQRSTTTSGATTTFRLPRLRIASGTRAILSNENSHSSINFSLPSGVASCIVNGDAKLEHRTERSRRTAPLGAGDHARPDSGVPQAPAAGPVRRILKGGHHRPHAAHPAPGLALLHQHGFRRRPKLRPEPVCPAPPSAIAGRDRLAHARHAQPRHGPVRPSRARTLPAAVRTRAALAGARPHSP